MKAPGITQRLFRGYGPLIGFAAIFLAMALFVPSVPKEVRQQVSTASSDGAAGGTDTEVLGESTSSVPGAGTTAVADPNAAAAAAAGGATTPGAAGAGGGANRPGA